MRKMAKIKTEIPSEIMKAIKEQEKCRTGNNLTRFYSYFEKQHGKVAIATVAVKDGKGYKGKKHPAKYIKKVAVHIQGEPLCNCRDVYFVSMGGYIAQWKNEQHLDGKTKRYIINQHIETWWQCENRYFRLYRTGDMLNPDFLKTTEFKYCAWDGKTDLLDYLNAYAKEPKTEMVTKLMGSRFALSKRFMKKVNSDANFLKWLLANRDECKQMEIPLLFQAYKFRDKWTISRVCIEYDLRNYFREPRYNPYSYAPESTLQQFYRESDEAGKVKIWNYLVRNNIKPHHYNDYLIALQDLSLSIKDTKNAFPIDWKYWQKMRIDQRATLIAKKNAEEYAKITKQIKAIAEKYSGLMFSGKNYAVVIADSKESLIREGEYLKHCVGRMNYDQKMCREESLIFFIRNVNEPDTPFVTVEFSIAEKRILQCYGYEDKKPDYDVTDFVNKWAEKAKNKVEKIQSQAA